MSEKINQSPNNSSQNSSSGPNNSSGENLAGNSFDKRDLNNPADRDALKRAADDLLKQNKPSKSEQAEAEEVEAIDPIEALVDENKNLKDQTLRLMADMENLRRRTKSDVASAKSYSIGNFALDMLSVADNLNRALSAIPEGARDNDAGLKTLAEGVEMTERAMMAALERHGVKKIDPMGQKFDPHFHQAMFEIPNETVAPNTVLQVAQTGFVIGERVLRPAIVGISKGGKKDTSVENS